MAPDHCFGLDHGDRIQNRREESVQPDEDQPIDVPQPHPRRGTCGLGRSPAGAEPGFKLRGSHMTSVAIVRRAEAWSGTRTSRLSLAQLSHSVTRARFSVATPGFFRRKIFDLLERRLELSCWHAQTQIFQGEPRAIRRYALQTTALVKSCELPSHNDRRRRR
jgi:hypothetical protein